MQATNNTFAELVGGSKQFVIPMFQRDYTWKKKEWDKLWDDIVRTRSVEVGHFVGAMVKVPARTVGATHSYLVIDGQQRLTTLMVLCVAIRDHLREINLQGDTPELNPEEIEGLFIKNTYETGDFQYKVKLRRADNKMLRAVIDGNDLDQLKGSQSPLIGEAYKHFREKLRQPNVDLTEIYRGTINLRIVDISLDQGVDDPQGVFESLNSTGVELSQSDLIRNFLLMRLGVPEQEKLYEEYWSVIESFFRSGDGKIDNSSFNLFLRDFITLKQRAASVISFDQLYDAFKAYHYKFRAENTLEDLLSEIRLFARYFASWNGRLKMPTPRLTDAMSNLRSCGNTTAVPVMQLYKCYENETLSEQEFCQALKLLESYQIRHAVRGYRIQSYPRIFAEMARDIKQDSPYTSLQETLLKSRGRDGFWTFQTNDEFNNALQERNLRALNIHKSILERLENDGEKEPSPTSTYTVEHIMPQTLNEPWKAMLGEDWEKIHQGWLHRLGNLTLTGYNSRYSNLPFEEKKTIPNGFNESAVRLNFYIRNQSEWTVSQIEERGKQLAERALKIWPHP